MLRIRRTAAGLSRRELAEALNIPTTTVKYAERGVASAEIVQLLDAFLPRGVAAVEIERRRPRVELRCEECGDPFVVASDTARFCSPTCRYRSRDRKRHVPRGTCASAVCDRCGKSFDYVRATRPRRRCDGCRPSGNRRDSARKQPPSPP
jgi:transcriptional regulator with XRE-family HTH domain